MSTLITQIVKRNGTVVPYDRGRIATAIFKAASAVGGSNYDEAERLALLVEDKLGAQYAGSTPSVEEIQDIVEETLIHAGHATTARAYIRYRQERAMARTQRAYKFEATDNIPYKKIYEAVAMVGNDVESSCR